MYVQNRKGLGELGSPITIALSVVSFIGSLFGKKPWTYRMVALVNRQEMSGAFCVLAYLGKTDRIQVPV